MASNLVPPQHIQLLANPNVTIPEVSRLEKINLGVDYANIQAETKSINLEISSFSNPVSYLDHKGFNVEFGAEMELVARLDNLVEQGNDFVSSLYTYRSVSRALPLLTMDISDEMTDSEKQDIVSRRSEIQKKIADILRPGILKIKEVMLYTMEATTTFHKAILHLVDLDFKKSPIPEGLYASLIRLIDVLVKLDNLKDMKSCLQNDFIRYKRSIGTQLSADVLAELQQVQSFVAGQDSRLSKNYIFLKLRDEVKRIRGHEQLLWNILSQAVENMESNLYVTPDERFQSLRVLPHIMILIDGDSGDQTSFNIYKTYKAKLGAIQKLFKKYPVVPLCGDMTITMHFILMRTGHYETSMASQWCPSTNDPKDTVYDITYNWETIQKSYSSYSVNVTALMNSLSTNPFDKVSGDNQNVLAEEVASIVYEGFAKLSTWNSLIQLYFAWKYTHPCPTENLEVLDAADANRPEMQYARALKHNITSQEIKILVDIISMIKSLAGILSHIESLLAPILRFYIHHTIQQLIQGDMLPLLHRVDKRKQPILSELLSIRQLAADWYLGVEPREDFKNYSRRFGHVDAKHPARVVGPSATQLQIVRSQVRALYDERSSVRQKNGFFIFARRELESVDIKVFEKFYQDSFYFPYLTNFSSTLSAVSDIGYLWYREFFLEFTKCIQFPIDMSVPWILTEYIISNQAHDDSPMIENILHTLSIYNDAAHRALFVLRQQHLYDEIEAEANLVFDQLIFLLADEIYSYYKNLAASMLLERSYKNKLEVLKGSIGHLTVKKRRYEIPLAQRQVQLLGRSINLSFLIGQHVNSKLFHDIDVALNLFESSDFSGIVELKSMLDIYRETHAQLSNELHLQVDDFSSILNEVNESHSPTNFKGRISFHILKTLVMDIFPNFSYNFYTHRFVRSPVILRPVEYAKPPKQTVISQAYGQHFFKAYEHWHKLSRGYIGKIHYDTLCSLSLYADLFMVIEECLQNFREKLEEITEYVEALQGGIPPLNFPKYIFEAAGSFGYFEGKLRPILEYDDLKPEVFQNIREIGNTVAFIRDMSDTLDFHKSLEFNCLAPYLGVAPDTTLDTKPSSSETPLGALLGTFSSLIQISDSSSSIILSHASTGEIRSAGNKLIESLTIPIIERKTLLRGALKRIHDEFFQLDLYNLWGQTADIGSVNVCSSLSIDGTKAFHKLWSALSFLFCLPVQSEDGSLLQDDSAITDEDEFGHGFTIGGCVIIHILGQRASFDLLDFSQHVLRVYEHGVNISSAATANAPVDQQLLDETYSFIEAFIVQKKLQDEIFALLEAQLNSSEQIKKADIVISPSAEEFN